MSWQAVLVIVLLVLVCGVACVILYIRARSATQGQQKAEDLVKAKEMSDAQLVQALGDPGGGVVRTGNTSPFVPADAPDPGKHP